MGAVTRDSVIVCGGRDYNDYDRVHHTLKLLKFDTIIWHGGARGADTLAGQAAEALGLDCVVVPAQWKRHGKAAGPIRNQFMLDISKARLVIAFPGGTGTGDMMRRARKAEVMVVAIQEQETQK